MRRSPIKRGLGNPIPEASRLAVQERENLRCLRCGGRGAEWHHRRGRRVKDDHTHCPCNGALLCGTCHRWAHANSAVAMLAGFVVSRMEPTPFAVPVDSWHGLIYLDCEGGFSALGIPVAPPE